MSDNLFAALRETVLATLAELHPDLPAGLAARIEVMPARDPAHGDAATNAALIAGKPLGLAPRTLAAGLAEGSPAPKPPAPVSST
jgi:arginyl-tRNA synthetase